MTRALRPLVTFRLYPEPGRTLYVRVNVWPTKRALHWHLHREHGMRRLRWTEGACTGLTVRHYDDERPERSRTDGIFAEVNFYRACLGMELVTHELFHATIAYGRRIGFDWGRLGADDSVNADEERLTYAHGRLCKAFVLTAERLRLYDPERWRRLAPARRPARAA